MKKSVAVETEETDSSTETENLLEHAPRRMSNPENQTSSSVSVTSEEVARRIKAVTDPLIQQLTHLCELMRELRNEQPHRRHEETASSRTVSASTGNVGRSDIITLFLINRSNYFWMHTFFNRFLVWIESFS